MHVAHAHLQIFVILRQIFRHPLGQGGDEDALIAGDAHSDFVEHVIHLPQYRTHLTRWVHQPCGPDHQFHHAAPFFFDLVLRRSGRGIDELLRHLLKLVKTQRAVVQRRGQPEAMLDQCFLAGAVTEVHPSDLRNRDMALVNDHERVLRQVADQGRRGASGFPALEDAAVVLDP